MRSGCYPHKKEIWMQRHTEDGQTQGMERRQPSKPRTIHRGNRACRHLILDFSLHGGGKHPACDSLWCSYASSQPLGGSIDPLCSSVSPNFPVPTHWCPCLTPWLTCSCGRSFLNPWAVKTFSVNIPLTVYLTCTSGLGARPHWPDNQEPCWSLCLPLCMLLSWGDEGQLLSNQVLSSRGVDCCSQLLLGVFINILFLGRKSKVSIP